MAFLFFVGFCTLISTIAFPIRSRRVLPAGNANFWRSPVTVETVETILFHVVPSFFIGSFEPKRWFFIPVRLMAFRETGAALPSKHCMLPREHGSLRAVHDPNIRKQNRASGFFKNFFEKLVNFFEDINVLKELT